MSSNLAGSANLFKRLDEEVLSFPVAGEALGKQRMSLRSPTCAAEHAKAGSIAPQLCRGLAAPHLGEMARRHQPDQSAE